MKLRVLLDMDGVIANFYSAFATYLNEEYGCNLNPNVEPKGYEFYTWGHGSESVDFDAASKAWIASGGFGKLPVFQGAKEFVDQLRSMCNVYIVTARIGDWDKSFPIELKDRIKNDTENWLKANGMPTDQLFFSHDKIPFCKENGISIMIEDKMSTALKASKNGMHTILMDRGYNGSQIDRYKIYRVYSFNEALEQLKKLMAK